MKGRVWAVLLMVVLSVALVASMTACQAEKPKKLKISWDMSTSYLMDHNIAKILLEDELGYEVEFVGLDNAPAFAGLAAGDIDIGGCWRPTHDEFINKYPGQVKATDTVMWEGMSYWAVPRYTSEKYGITKFSDLARPEIVELFDKDGDGIAELSGGCPGFADTLKNDFKIEKAELPYEQIVAAFGAQIVRITSGFEKHEDFVFYWWTPQSPMDKFDKVILEDDYGYWPDPEKKPGYSGWPPCTVHYVYRAGLEDEHPEVVELLNRIVTSVEDEGKFLVAIDEQGLEKTPEGTEEVARAWISEHRDTVDEWLKGLK